MYERLDSLDDEEQREVASIRERCSDIKPYVSAAAVVFALTPFFLAPWLRGAFGVRTPPVLRPYGARSVLGPEVFAGYRAQAARAVSNKGTHRAGPRPGRTTRKW